MRHAVSRTPPCGHPLDAHAMRDEARGMRQQRHGGHVHAPLRLGRRRPSATRRQRVSIRRRSLCRATRRRTQPQRMTTARARQILQPRCRRSRVSQSWRRRLLERYQRLASRLAIGKARASPRPARRTAKRPRRRMSAPIPSPRPHPRCLRFPRPWKPIRHRHPTQPRSIARPEYPRLVQAPTSIDLSRNASGPTSSRCNPTSRATGQRLHARCSTCRRRRRLISLWTPEVAPRRRRPRSQQRPQSR